jgi:hypothetical protein
LNLTALAPVKLEPLMVTLVPAGPLVGLKPEIEGAGGTVGTVKLLPLVAVPAAVVTLIGPVVAPAGTVAMSHVSQTTAKLAATPLNLTDVAPARYVPLIATFRPESPELGRKLVSVGVLW